MTKLNIPMILSHFLYSADTATNDDTYRLRKIITVEIAQELYGIWKDKLDEE